MKKLNTVLITGGLGFIGTNLIPSLKREIGAHIRIIDNNSNPSGDLDVSGLEVIDADIRDTDAVNRALKGVDAVVHLAGHTRVMDSIEKPVFNFETNVVAMIGILERMREIALYILTVK